MLNSAMDEASMTRRYRFVAQHRLHSERLSDEENRRVFGKCNNPNGHGHNYVVLVTVRGPIDQRSGRVTEVDELDRLVADVVISRFDHRDLNGDPGFSTSATTGENLVRFVWDLLVKRIPAGRLVKVGLIETRDNCFEYSG